MAIEFKFSAKSPDGKIISGKVKAASEGEVKARLRDKGFQPISVTNASVSQSLMNDVFQKRIDQKELQVFLRQLSIMIKAGVPLIDSLDSLRDSAFSKFFSLILNKIISDINNGLSFSQAMQNRGGAFSPMVINLIKAGEAGGVLDEVLDRLAVYFEKRQKLQSKVKGALIYPIVTVVVSVAALAAVLIFVVPKFEDLFSSQGQDLPDLTKFVVNISDAFVANWYLILFVVIGAPMILVVLYRLSIIKSQFDAFVFKIPLFGDLIKRSSIARMSRTLGILLKSGVRLNEGLDVTIKSVDNLTFQKIMNRAKEQIIEGRSFSEPIKSSGFFPKLVVQMITTGEKTGNLDNMLERMADFYDEEVENTADQLTSLLEPMIIVFLGGMIGFIVIAMFLPIFNLGDAIV